MICKSKWIHYFFILVVFNVNSLVAQSPIERLSSLSIFDDSPDLDNCGYNNCNMETNGEMQALSLLRPEDVIFDVGANVGEWTTLAFLSEQNIASHCFEPVPPMFEKLKENIISDRVIFSMTALSDYAGEAYFYYYPEYPQLSTFHRRPIEIEKQLNMEPIVIVVQMQRLDSYCLKNGINQINFLKIDTEGHELNVLNGSTNLLEERAIDIIQFEYGGCYLDAKTTLEEVYRLLSGYSYDLYRIIPEGFIHIQRWRPELENFKYANYLAVRK